MPPPRTICRCVLRQVCPEARKDLPRVAHHATSQRHTGHMSTSFFKVGPQRRVMMVVAVEDQLPLWSWRWTGEPSSPLDISRSVQKQMSMCILGCENGNDLAPEIVQSLFATRFASLACYIAQSCSKRILPTLPRPAICNQ